MFALNWNPNIREGYLGEIKENRTDPFETLVKTITTGSTCSLDVPGSLPESVQAELIRDLRRVHGVREILLVCEDKEEGIAKLIFVQHSLELLARLRHTLAIVRVDDEDDSLGVLEVCIAEGR
jgi:hypothetical protein